MRVSRDTCNLGHVSRVPTLAGLMGMEMNCQPGHAALGLGLIASCSNGWSGI